MQLPNRNQKVAYAARISQKLSGPSEAITGFVDLLVDEVTRNGPANALDDLTQVQVAATRLGVMIANISTDPRDIASDPNLQAQLRHDLRSPINAIIGYGEMIAEDFESSLAPSALDDLNVILREARRLTVRIDEIVDGAHATEDETQDLQNKKIAAKLEQSLSSAVRPKDDLVGNILVIDDEAPNREILTRQLKNRGHSVRAVGSAAETFEALDQEIVDLILLDILMPDVNGIEVLQRLKTTGELNEIPVVMVSGLKETDAVAKCLNLGAEDYLPKPIDPILLHARVDACLERKRWRAKEIAFAKEIKFEKDRADALLSSMLPAPIIQRLNEGETQIADRFDEATIIFADIVDFTPLVARMDASELVRELSSVFTEFDALAERHGIEKIKTIGDAYMAASGIPVHRNDHADAAVDFTKQMIARIEDSSVNRAGLQIRVGIHTGPVIAGIIGRTRSVYDVWGATVNLASRLEATGQAGRIHVSAETMHALSDGYLVSQKRVHDIKGVGPVTSYFIE